MPSAERRELLLETALRMARQGGAGSLTLARVADASGVSKPIAYQHFSTLTGLLRAMFQQVGAEYEGTVREVMSGYRESTDDAEGALQALCAAYVSCTLENKALHADIAATLVASGEPAGTLHADDAERYLGLIAELLNLDQSEAYALTVGFLGAAERLCEAVDAGRLTRQRAVEVLVGFFPRPRHPSAADSSRRIGAERIGAEP